MTTDVNNDIEINGFPNFGVSKELCMVLISLNIT